MNQVAIPPGMVEVTEAEFFRLLYADPRDILPQRNSCYWETKERLVWGWASPRRGWNDPSNPRRWAVAATSNKGSP